MCKEKTYEDPSPTLRRRTLPAETLNLAVRVDLVVLEDGHLDFLALVLDLLGGLEKRAASAHRPPKTTSPRSEARKEVAV